MSNLLKLQKIFREILNDTMIQLTKSFAVADNPDWDSVAMVQIVLAVEEEFKVRFTTEEVANIKSVADILKVIEK